MTLKLSPNENSINGIIFIGYNQNKECFSVGLHNGFRIYNADPLKEYMRCELNMAQPGTGVGYVEMLYRTSFIGILGGGKTPHLPPSRFSLWEGDVKKFILEMSFKSEIKAIKLRHDRIVIVFNNSLNVYTFSTQPELLYTSETIDNPMGIIAVSQSKLLPIIVHPGQVAGSVIIAHVVQNSGLKNSNPRDLPPPRCIMAHKNSLVALAINDPGTMLATASSRGTLIRIFDTKTCQVMYCLRRGSYLASITNICFDPTSQLICTNSDHCTVHIFDLNSSGGLLDSPVRDNRNSYVEDSAGCGSSISCINSPQKKPSKSLLSASDFLPKNLLSVKTVTSQVRIHLDHSYKSICAFSQAETNTIIVLSSNGSYSKYKFSLVNGTYNRLINVNFLDYNENVDV